MSKVEITVKDGIKSLDVDGQSQGRAYESNPNMAYSPYVIEMLDALKQHPTAKSALCIGLGPGLLATALIESGLTVDAVDTHPEMFFIAQTEFDYKGSCSISDGLRYLKNTKEKFI